MTQSRITSLRESLTNTAWGFAISLVAQYAFLPLIGVPIVLWQNVVFAMFMTFVSIARGYVVRRWFEKKRMSFPVTPALVAVAAERERQKNVEGYQLTHDDDHDAGELGAAGASYLLSAQCTLRDDWPAGAGLAPPRFWPWSRFDFKPKRDDVRRDLVRGVALGLAELERFDRMRKRRAERSVAESLGLRPGGAALPEYAHGKSRSEHAGPSA